MNRLLAPIAVLVLLPLPVLAPALGGSRAFVPFDHRAFAPWAIGQDPAVVEAARATGNFDITEKTLVCVPELELAHAELAAGRLPTWDPYARCGAPLFATGISGMGSPQGWLHLLMEPARAFVWTAWLTAALAGLLTFGWLRSVDLRRESSLFGAIVFAWSGVIADRMHLFQHTATLVWLPGMLWAIEALPRRPRAAPAALALATWCCVTGGYPPSAIASGGVAAAWWLMRVATATDGARKRVLVGGAIGFALGLGLAAYQLVPMAAYFAESGRDADPALQLLRRQSELDPAQWLGFVLPHPFGTPALNRPGGVPYDRSPLLWLLHSRARDPDAAPRLQWTEQQLYLGALPLTLVPWALQRRRLAWTAMLLAATCLVLAAGRGGYDMLATWIVPLRLIQPMELMPPIAALGALLAALGFDRVLFENARKAKLGATAIAASLALLAAAAWLALTVVSAERLDRAFFDVLAMRWGDVYRRVGDATARALLAPALPPARSLLRADLLHAALAFATASVTCALALRWAKPARRLAIATVAIELVALALPWNRAHAPPPRLPTEVEAFLLQERDHAAERGGFTVARVAPRSGDGTSAPETPLALPPDTLMPLRIRDLNAYTFVDGRSHLPFAALYRDSRPPILLRGRFLAAFPDDERLQHPLFDLLGVRFLLCHTPPGKHPPQHAGVSALPALRGPGGSFEVFERPHPCPRAFVVPRAEVLADDDAVRAEMVRPDFDPRAAALLTRDEATHLVDMLPRDRDAPCPPVRFVLDRPTHVRLTIDGANGGFLLWADAAFEGWQATIDGRPVPLLRADSFLRAVPLPRGDVVLDCRYTAPGLRLGVAISAAALLLFVLLVHRAWSRR